MALKSKLIAYTGWSKGKSGLEYPSRFVALYHSGKEPWPAYSTSMEVKDGVHKENYIHGHYDIPTKKEAIDEMIERLNKHNKSYGPTNISHMDSRVTILKKK